MCCCRCFSYCCCCYCMRFASAIPVYIIFMATRHKRKKLFKANFVTNSFSTECLMFFYLLSSLICTFEAVSLKTNHCKSYRTKWSTVYRLHRIIAKLQQQLLVEKTIWLTLLCNFCSELFFRWPIHIHYETIESIRMSLMRKQFSKTRFQQTNTNTQTIFKIVCNNNIVALPIWKHNFKTWKRKRMNQGKSNRKKVKERK